MCQINVADVPHSCLRGRMIDALSKERQLKPECLPIACRQVTRVIPPLSLKILVIEMVPREFVPIAGCCLLVQSRGWPSEEQDRCPRRHPTLHESPQAG